MPIRVLDPRVAAQIAAGEVVERPASIVKELVENALDAGATRVSVSVRGGGIDELVIQDDGSGIPADQIELAFARHATSKLTNADDLWAINTLGFRGEALPSIAAIAQVSCVSRTAGDAVGTELRIAGGDVQSIGPRGASQGTTFTIRNLFYNVPVRRAFLKSAGVEAGAIAAVVTQYALAYPQVAFTMVRDGKRLLQTSGRSQLADVILELYGVEVARQMIPIDARAGEDIGAVHIQGMVSAPTVSRSARDGMHITVNGRAIAARGAISAMIEQAYHTLLMKGRFPVVVLQIQVHPAAVDVNVHPTKSEVKFRQPELVAYTLGRAVRAVVQEAVVIQNWQPEGSAAPGDGTAAAVPPAEEDGVDELEVPPPTPRVAENETLPFSAAARLAEPDVDDRPQAAPPPSEPTPIQAALLDEEPRYREPAEPQPRARLAEVPWDESPVERGPYDRGRDEDAERRLAALQALGQRVAEPRAVVPEPAPAPPEPGPAPVAPGQLDSPAPRLPPLRALAQLAQTYLLTEGPGGALYLIDQHAAHERITYERLLAQHAAGVIQSQALLMPQLVGLPPAARHTLLGAADELATWGFELADAEGGVDVQAVPAGLAMDTLNTTLVDLASHLAGGQGHTPAKRRDAMLATLACHTSVRAGQTLTSLEQQALIDQLGDCEGPRTCPHGRPTLIVLTKHQLEQQFGRLGA